MKNQETNLSSRKLQIEVNFHQLVGKSILVCTHVRMRKDWLMTCTLVLTIVFFSKSEFFNKESRALDVVDIQRYKQSGESFNDGHFSMQSLILMMKWVTKKDFYGLT